MTAIQGMLPLYRFENLGAGCIHAITTRLGGFSEGPFASLNVGHTVGDDAAHVEANHKAIYATLGLDAGRVVSGHQVHGERVALVAARHAGQVLPATDGLVTDTPGLTLMLRFADCVPLLFWDPERRVAGIAHAGWRGTVARIAAKTARTMIDVFGCSARSIRAAIGPSIGPCCFEVGPEVVEQIRAAFGQAAGNMIRAGRGDRSFVDLWRANAWQLENLGLERIETAQVCTCCHKDSFFSHRGDGGRTGRFAGLIGIRET